MTNAIRVFKDGVNETRKMTVVYSHFVNDLNISHDEISDILRAQIVNVVSAFDRLIHELVTIGVVEIFLNKRVQTKKFLNQPFKAETLIKSIELSKPDFIPSSINENPQYLIEKEMREKLSYLAFQAPEKVKDALSYIWDNEQKALTIAVKMGITGANDNDKRNKLEQELKLIVDRRNQIVHEGDIDPITNSKRLIDTKISSDAIDFIEKLGESIYELVIDTNCYIHDESS